MISKVKKVVNKRQVAGDTLGMRRKIYSSKCRDLVFICFHQLPVEFVSSEPARKKDVIDINWLKDKRA